MFQVRARCQTPCPGGLVAVWQREYCWRAGIYARSAFVPLVPAVPSVLGLQNSISVSVRMGTGVCTQIVTCHGSTTKVIDPNFHRCFQVLSSERPNFRCPKSVLDCDRYSDRFCGRHGTWQLAVARNEQTQCYHRAPSIEPFCRSRMSSGWGVTRMSISSYDSSDEYPLHPVWYPLHPVW